jgi:hypothetical protein
MRLYGAWNVEDSIRAALGRDGKGPLPSGTGPDRIHAVA